MSLGIRGALALISIGAACSLGACGGKMSDGQTPSGVGDGFIMGSAGGLNATVNSAQPAASGAGGAGEPSDPDNAAGTATATAETSTTPAPNRDENAAPAPYVADLVVHEQELLYVAKLSSAQEVPPNGAPSSGSIQLIVDASRSRFRYHIECTLAAPAAAYLQRSIATLTGPTLHLLPLAQSLDGTDVFAPGEERELARGRWYVNIPTVAHPSGEVRGQLLLPGETLYSAVLSDSNEVPAVASGARGNAQLVLSADKTLVRYEAAFFAVEPTYVQISEGAPNAVGPVIYPLTLLPEYSETTAASAGASGVRGVTPEDLSALNAGTWYINARSNAFPSGAARGQLNRADQ